MVVFWVLFEAVAWSQLAAVLRQTLMTVALVSKMKKKLSISYFVVSVHAIYLNLSVSNQTQCTQSCLIIHVFNTTLVKKKGVMVEINQRSTQQCNLFQQGIHQIKKNQGLVIRRFRVLSKFMFLSMKFFCQYVTGPLFIN